MEINFSTEDRKLKGDVEKKKKKKRKKSKAMCTGRAVEGDVSITL